MIKKSKYKEGDKIGDMTLVKDTGKRDEGGQKIWLCKCTCGNLEERNVPVMNQNLKTKNITPKCKKCFIKKMQTYNIGPRFADDPERKEKAIEARGQVEDTALCQITDKRKLNRNNNTGHRGISLLNDGRFRVRLCFQRREVFSGVYNTLEDAINARKAAEARYYEPMLKKYQEAEKCTKSE